MADERHVVISCDCHAVGRPEDYTPYIDPAYREQHEEFVRHQRRAAEALARHRIGLDRVIWARTPRTSRGPGPGPVRSLRRTFPGVPAEETRRILTDNPAALYGFDGARLSEAASVVGPTVDELAAR